MDKRMSLYDKVISVFLDVLLVIFGLLLVVSIYNSIQIHVLGNDYSSFFGYSTFEVETGSMSPTILAGDWIIVKKSDDIGLNDIVTFRKDGEFITHRVIESYKNTFITKGDANSGKDESINKDQIIGTVVKILPKFGVIRKTLFNPVVLITLIVSVYLIGYLFRNNGNKTSSKKVDSYVESVFSMIKKKTSSDKKVTTVCDNASSSKEEVIEPIDEPIIESSEEVVESDSSNEVVTESNESNEEVAVLIPSENEEKVESEEIINETNDTLSEEDLDKTLYFRTISVDAEDVEYTPEPILITDEDEEEEEEKVVEEVVDEEEKDTIIKNRRKKFKNIIDKVMYYKREELEKLVSILNKNDKLKVNETQIRDDLLDVYIDGKYYNFCGNVNTEYNKKNMLLRIDGALKFKADSLCKKYKGNDKNYKNKVDKFVTIFSLLNNLEKIYLTTPKIGDKRESYKSKIEKVYKNQLNEFELDKTIEDLLDVQKKYNQDTTEILNEQSSNTFELEYKSISSADDLFSADLKHNIGFSKVYSEYIIDKTYSEGIIAEEKTIITLNLLFVRLIKDVFGADFSNRYVIYVPDSIYSKTNKLNKVFNMLEDEYAKSNVIILVEYNHFIKNKKVISGLKKNGYHFAVNISTNDKVNVKNLKNISIADYVFVDKSLSGSDFISSIPEGMKVIYDNVISRFISNGGK